MCELGQLKAYLVQTSRHIIWHDDSRGGVVTSGDGRALRKLPIWALYAKRQRLNTRCQILIRQR